ncbi:MAG: UvrD-helicase domain-containing protein, partial [Firmicutes bacterium]|nr:UvrD-helicase domain-containing protein [Bacillota bacterium]
MKFNNEQLKAINTTNQNILVSASAGAGKTSVLVERLIKRCIKDGIAINKIIALTFTDAAASEMKKRLSKSLNILYQDPNSDHEYIKQQLVYLQNADISTIDAFCLKLVKKYYYVIHLDPKMATNILDDSTISQINNKAFDISFKKMMDSDEEKMITLLNYFSPRSEDITNLKEAIFSIISCANGTADKDKWYNIAKANYQHIKNIKELPEYLLSAYYHYLTNNLNIIKNNLIYLQDNIITIEKVTDKQI